MTGMPKFASTGIWTLAFLAFVGIHYVATFYVTSMAFGYGEAESELALPFSIAMLLLAPLFLLGDWLTFFMPDNTALRVGIVLNGLLWWGIVFVIVRIIRNRNAAAS